MPVDTMFNYKESAAERSKRIAAAKSARINANANHYKLLKAARTHVKNATSNSPAGLHAIRTISARSGTAASKVKRGGSRKTRKTRKTRR